MAKEKIRLLKNVETGVFFRYTEELAKLHHMVEVNPPIGREAKKEMEAAPKKKAAPKKEEVKKEEVKKEEKKSSKKKD